jgi:hypothetical protein
MSQETIHVTPASLPRIKVMEPLPTAIFDSYDPPLPVKIEAARAAIAACIDLPELLRYRDQAQGIAAALRVMRDIGPELVRKANMMVKEAHFKLGELLAQYKGTPPGPQPGRKGGGGGRSERAKVIEDMGIKPVVASCAVRLAAIPDTEKERLIQDDSVSSGLSVLVKSAPPIRAQYDWRAEDGAYHRLMYGGNGPTGGLRRMLELVELLRSSDARALHKENVPEVKKIINKIAEKIDEIDRLCGPGRDD